MRIQAVLLALFLGTLVHADPPSKDLATDAEKRKTIDIAPEVFANAQQLGKVTAGDLRPSVIQFGQHFVGERVSGKLLLQNRSDRELAIERIKSSCGCAMAWPARSRIAAESDTDLLIRIELKKAGPFGIKIMLETDRGKQQIGLVGTAQEQLELGSNTATAFPELATVNVTVLVNDQSIDPDQLTLSTADGDAKQVNSKALDSGALALKFQIPKPPAQGPAKRRVRFYYTRRLVGER